MRLIDADALIDNLNNWAYQESPSGFCYDTECKEYSAVDMQRMVYRTIRDAISAVEERPTIEPERKKGKWLACGRDSRGYSDAFECSCCENLVTYAYYVSDIDYDYCPNCGADMRDENDG